MRSRAFETARLLVLLVAGGASTAQAAPPLESCELGHPGVPVRIKAQCGVVSVPEDPARPGARHIDLRVAILRATGNRPAADPIFFLAGGPGQAATEAWVVIADIFERSRRTRDIVLVDQRGTGGSNALDCELEEDLTTAVDLDRVRALTKRCLDSLPGDPRFYTTSIAMEDLERVRIAFGYRRINLVGISYGTRAALTYLRRHPDRVRTMVLQGVVPSELALGLAHAKHLDGALALQFDRCARDTACGAAFPELPRKLRALIDRVDRDPPQVTIPDPRSGEPLPLTMDRPFFAAGIRFLAYLPETAALIPLLLHEAHETGDFDRLAAQSAIVARQIHGAISTGMELSVICTEDVPLFGDADADAGRDRDTLLGDTLVRLAKTQCELWKKGEMPPDFHAPVVSDVPSLLISGELDPVTPPADAEKVKRHLSRARHLVLPGHGHMMARGCMPKLLDEFFQTANPDLDARCLDSLRAPPFFVRLTGPEP
jgi:pimeloyl-ACP methyl ester carboxylesterase